MSNYDTSLEVTGFLLADYGTWCVLRRCFAQLECALCSFAGGGGGGGPPGAGRTQNLEDLMKSMGGLRGKNLIFLRKSNKVIKFSESRCDFSLIVNLFPQQIIFTVTVKICYKVFQRTGIKLLMWENLHSVRKLVLQAL